MDGWWKNESHSLSQSNTSKLLLGNGLKEEGSFVRVGRSLLQYLILWNQ